jgi:ketosteroid isomerase-like protein
MGYMGSTDDRLAIRERIERYSDAVFRRDEAAWAENWAEQAVWSLAGTEVSGKDAIVSMWRQAMTQFSFVAFFATPGAIEISGDSATARVYTSEVLAGVDGNLSRILGRYDDRLVRKNDQWLFAERRYTILHQS